MTICWMNGVTAITLRPKRMAAMVSAPMIAPLTLPRPPIRLAPPITTAAIASNS